jgi:hypothetical protein
METLLSILLGLGLAAACGFRVFVPLLIMSIASRAGAGHLELGQGFSWSGAGHLLGGYPAGDRRLLHSVGG